MTSIPLCVAFLLGVGLPAPAPAPSAARGVCARAETPYQDDEERVPDQREDVAERIEAFGRHIKKRGREDPQAVEILDALTSDFESFGPKDRGAVVKVLGAALKVKRPVELDVGVPDDRLYIACAAALGEMGPDSVALLLKHLGGKTHRKNVRLQEFFLRSLGKTQDLRGIKPLLQTLDHRHMALQAAAARALEQHRDLPLKERKRIFKELLDILMAQKGKKDGDVTDQEAFERYNTISGAFMSTMEHLSGNREKQPERWRKWWNENKKGDWGA